MAVCCLSASALAGPITYSFSSGNRSATAEFAKSGSNLVVTLTNTSTADALVPTDVLTGVFFDVIGNLSLTRTSALVPLTSAVRLGGTGADITPGDRVVGGEWSYLNSIVQVPPQNSGISSSGLNIFGPGNLFPGPNLEGPSSPDGIQYGITTAGDNLLTGNGGITGTGLIKNSVVFTLGGWSGEPDAVIVGAYFQYGTALEEPGFTGDIPEPGAWALMGLGSVGLLMARRMRGGRRG